MGAIFLGLGLCVVVTLAYAVCEAVEEQRRRSAAAKTEEAQQRGEGFAGAVHFFNSIPRVECAWCGKVLQPGKEPVSHGICPECSQEHFGIVLSKEARR